MSDQMPPGMPAWLQISLLVLAVIVGVVVVLMVAGVGGEHGPGMHQP